MTDIKIMICILCYHLLGIWISLRNIWRVSGEFGKAMYKYGGLWFLNNAYFLICQHVNMSFMLSSIQYYNITISMQHIVHFDDQIVTMCGPYCVYLCLDMWEKIKTITAQWLILFWPNLGTLIISQYLLIKDRLNFH